MRISILRQVTLALLFSSTALLSPSISAEFTVSTPSVVTNGAAANVLNGNDSLTIDANGSITTAGASLRGVLAIGTNNNISNSGKISTSGTDSHGVIFDSNSSVSNAGSIVTTGTASVGIIGVDGNTIVNAGTISTSGEPVGNISSFGIIAGSNNTITNAGTITTQGTTAHAIASYGSNNTITNAGTITVNGTTAYGLASLQLFLGPAIDKNDILINTGTIVTNGVGGAGIGAGGAGINKLTINNSGSITTNGNAHGILVLNDSTVTNSGEILAKGPNAVGILGVTGNTVDHSGKVVSVQKEAFQFTGSDNQLNLLAPAYIGGAIDMGTINVASVTTGRSHSNLWTIGGNPAGVSIAGPVPWAWDATTKQFATLDPTALSAAPSLLANKVSGLSNLTRYNSGNKWWLQGYGNFSNQNADGIYNEFYNIEGGFAAGATTSLNEHLDLGAMIGYSASHLNVNSKWVSSQTIASQGFNGAIYGTARMDDLFLDFALYAGGQSNNSDRFVNDNLEALGEDYALATFNSWFLAPEIRLGVNVQTDGDWTITPSASARMSSQWIDGYTETGSNANATVAAHLVQVLEGDIELAAMRKIDNGEVTLKGGLTYQQNLGTTTQDIALLGQTLAIPVNVAGILGGYVGVEGSYDINDHSTLNISAKAYYASNSSYGVSGTMGLKSEF